MALLPLSGGAAMAQAASDRAKTLEVASFGGQLDVIFQKVFAAFEKAHGITIHWMPGAPAQNLAKVGASRGHPEFDVALLENQTQHIGSKQGVWAPIDQSIVTNYKDIAAEATVAGKDSVGIGFHYTAIFYRPDEFAKHGWAAPHSWNDLFRPEFCGSIGVMHPNIAYTLTALIMISGGDTAKSEDGIKRFEAIKNCVPVLEPNSPKLEAKVRMGEYVIGFHSNIRSIPLQESGTPIKFVIPDEGVILGQSMAAPVKDAPNAKLA
jgi:putative spermidine/putrescine transport system substrate-binding protein